MSKIIDLKNLKKTEEKTEPTIQLIRPASKIEPEKKPDTIPSNIHASWEYQLSHALGRRQLIYLFSVIGLMGLGSWFFGFSTSLIIFLALAIALILINQSKKSRGSKIEIHDSGITINSELVYYRDLKSFWIEYNPGGIKELSLESGRWYLPYIKIPLIEQNPTHLHAHLAKYLPEREHEVSLVDAFLKRN